MTPQHKASGRVADHCGRRRGVLHYSDYFKDVAIGHFMVAHTWHFNLFVDLFFVVSGFVIARQYFGRVNDAGSIGRFLWRRLARIYPLHLATLAFYLALAGALHFGAARTDNPARYPLSDLPAQFLLLHAFVGERLTFNFPSWSLSAEMFCYLLFPPSR
jgi:peptidoglycan/LPS O-acetylase OafA/YrhL